MWLHSAMAEELEMETITSADPSENAEEKEEKCQPTRVERIMLGFNAKNAKKVAMLMVLGFVAYHGLLNWRYGSDSCQWLMSKGRFKGDKEWQPYGCMLHKYTTTDARNCMRYLGFWGKENHFVFIGDIRVRLLYESFINQLHPHDELDKLNLTEDKAQQDASFVERKLKMNAMFVYAERVTDDLIEKLLTFEDVGQMPGVFVLGFADKRFYQGNVTAELLQEYSYNLQRLLQPIKRLTERKSKVLWRLQDRVYEEKLPAHMKVLRNEHIDKLNEQARHVFGRSPAIIWQSAWHITNGLLHEAVKGYLPNTLALSQSVQILLNMYCNDYMNQEDGSCCASAEPYTNLQLVSYAAFGVAIACVAIMFLRRCCRQLLHKPIYMPLQTSSGVQDSPPPEAALQTIDYAKPIVAIAILGIIMAYFYLCDRTNFFMKENKYYSEFSFWIPVGYAFALGIFFSEEARYTKVLNRNQMDELKGWILLVVLIYYMTGAHRVLPIHMHIKLLISAYLFLAGFTHFSYMWQTGSSGFVRFFQVMFRINFMTIVLCFCMNRPYQFYYFVPLLSFWLCTIYFLLLLPPRITEKSLESNNLHYLYLVAKFVGCFSIITVLFMSEVFFERIFVTRPWKALFVSTDDDIHEWWYQWKLDRYTVMFGLVFAAAFHIAQKYGMFDDNNHNNLFSRRTSITATLLAVFGVGFYTVFSFLCRSENNCEEIHSYIVFIPIVGGIVLRNISGILRTRYSTFFAWFGRISIELFICQYHIWLAADRHGVLVLLPGFPTLNMIITSFIFVCASHEVHRITQILLPYAVPNDWRLVVRNFIAFLIILLPVAKSDGMF